MYPITLNSGEIVLPNLQMGRPQFPPPFNPNHNTSNITTSSRLRTLVIDPYAFHMLWLNRLARTGGRFLVGDILDELILIPSKILSKFQNKLGRAEKYFEANTLWYSDLPKVLKTRKLTPHDIVFKNLINKRFAPLFWDVFEGRVFNGLGRLFVTGLYAKDTLKYAKLAYKDPFNRKENLQRCAKSLLKWIIGTELGLLGYALGLALKRNPHNQKVTCFMIEALFAAGFDFMLNKLITTD